MAYHQVTFLILIQFFILQTFSSSSWQTLRGKPPVVIARGGFSGLFPDSSDRAYLLAKILTSPDITLWCDLQLTKDGVGICFPNLSLNNGSDIKDVYPNSGIVDDTSEGWFSTDYTWKQLSNVRLVQNIYSRLPVFDHLFPILTVREVAKIGASGLWLNIQHSAFYVQHNLSMKKYVISLSRRVKINFISSPDITFLQSMTNHVKRNGTKLIFKFLDQVQINPFTNQTYGSLVKNLSYIRTVSSGILVPKSYIWPVESGYLQPYTSLVTDAHKEDLKVFASEFANDLMFAYNFSYDATAEYLSFIDNGNFSVDGFLSDFPLTPYRAISCFSHVDTKAKEQANITIISKNGASGDYPDCTDLAYQKAVENGVDIIDCHVQMSQDSIPFCLSSIDLLNNTNVAETSFTNLSLLVPEIQQKSGIYTFSLTMSQIRSLKPAISNPLKDSNVLRNPRNKNAGKLLTLSDFLSLSSIYSSLSGILISVENAAYLSECQGISVIDAVLKELKKATQQNQKPPRTLIMSTDKSVLIKLKETKMNHELVYQVDENIRDITDSAINDIKDFAGLIVINKKSVYPTATNTGLVRLNNATSVVPRLQSHGFRVYVETFSNEFQNQPVDFFSDPTVEIDSFVRNIGINGIITDFPATTARYRKNQCYMNLDLAKTGELINLADETVLAAAEAPYPSLDESDMIEPPLPEVNTHLPPASTSLKADAKVLSMVITMAVLVTFFISHF